MKTLKILAITGVTLVAALLLVSTVAAMGPFGSNVFGGYGGMMGGRYGGGMMGGYGYGYNGSPYTNQPSTTTPSTQYYQPVYPYHVRRRMAWVGLRLWRNDEQATDTTAPYTNTGTPLTITDAKTIAQNYVASIGNPDLTVKAS